MGRIVGGFATSHVLFSPDGVEEQAERVFAGMMEIRAAVRALAPDVLVVASGDHLNNFTLRQQVTLAVGIADSFVPWGDMGIPQTPFAGHRAFAEGVARHAAMSGFDLVQVEEVRPDHGLMLTKLIGDPHGDWPVVPVFINSAMPVPPTPARCFALGEALRVYVEDIRPADERVVVIGGGGLSHWLRMPEQGRVAEHYDRRVLCDLVEGRAHVLARSDNAELLAETGNGGLEVASWLFMAGAMPAEARGEIVYYEPMIQWGSGMGGVAFHV
jgi:hypothetical protein